MSDNHVANLLDLDARAEVHDAPYRWAHLDSLLPPTGLAALHGAVPPLDRFQQAERLHGGDKTYRMRVLPLVARGQALPVLDELDGTWSALTTAVQSPEYRAWMGGLLDVDITESPLDVGLFAFEAGDWVSAHTDKPNKLATQILYLTRSWKPHWGGSFQIHDDGGVRERLLPLPGSSVMFARSDRSWHAVEAVSEQAGEVRLTAQVEVWAG